MGKKKTKVGKQRLDRYYHLAKEQGYRARSAFKLIQLCQKLDILSGCRTLLDLCAAPGGWLQVAQKHMPVASTIVGVDLVSIKPIRGVITIQADITTPRCRSLLKQHIAPNACDVVLHDGAPNVGASWGHDAYAQNELVLHATKLACEFSRPGATYVTKVFRSQDYASLLWVFQQLFNRVTATKPSSSRSVSAEIFVICEGFKNLAKLPVKLFDPKFVFVSGTAQQQQLQSADSDVVDSVEVKKRGLAELLKSMSKKNREGYSEGDDYRVASASEFFEQTSQSPSEFLVSHHKLTFPADDQQAQRIKNDSLTDEDVLHYCSDLRVLGRGEYMTLLKWRIKILKKWAQEEKQKTDGLEPIKKEEEVDSEAENMAWEKELVELCEKKRKETLNAKRRIREKLSKLKKQRDASLGAFDAAERDPELFSLAGKKFLEEEDEMLERSGVLGRVAKWIGSDESEADDADRDDSSQDAEKLDPTSRLAVDLEIAAEMEKRRASEAEKLRMEKKRKKTRREQAFAEWSREMSSFANRLEDENLESRAKQTLEMESSSDEEGSDDGCISVDTEDDAATTASGDLDARNCRDGEIQNKAELNERRTSRWFDQEPFKAIGITLEDLAREDAKGEDLELQECNSEHGSDYIEELSDSELPQMPLTEKQKRKEKRKREQEKKEAREARKKAKVDPLGIVNDQPEDRGQFEEVPIDESAAITEPTFADEGDEEDEDAREEYVPKTPDELAEVQALGLLLSKKASRMDLIDGAYNRYAFADDERCLPEWFKEDEATCTKPELPETKEMVRQFRAKMKEIARRPIRKVLEAEARKKTRLKKRLEKVKKQAEGIAESAEHTEFTKAKSIRSLISKARRGDKKEKIYLVSRKKGGALKTTKVKAGAVKVVDRRLKADKRGKRAAERRHKKRR